jgi:hypothetical protein
VLIKDHTYSTRRQFALLCILDELGNRRFGIPSAYHYQRGFSWCDAIAGAKFSPMRIVHPVQCERGLLGRVTNPMQFIGLWQRAVA